MLVFEISERTVLRWMRKAPRDVEPARRRAAFLSNHREAIAAMDFFTVPTLGCGLLYCLFMIHHAKRRFLQCIEFSGKQNECYRIIAAPNGIVLLPIDPYRYFIDPSFSESLHLS